MIARRVARACATAACLACVGLSAAFAQTPAGGVEGQLLQRQQYQDELLLRQRQFQERLDPSLTPAQRQEVDRRQFEQSQRQRQQHDEQIQRHLQLEQVLPQMPEARQQEQLQLEQQRSSREREELLRQPDP